MSKRPSDDQQGAPRKSQRRLNMVEALVDEFGIKEDRARRALSHFGYYEAARRHFLTERYEDEIMQLRRIYGLSSARARMIHELGDDVQQSIRKIESHRVEEERVAEEIHRRFPMIEYEWILDRFREYGWNYEKLLRYYTVTVAHQDNVFRQVMTVWNDFISNFRNIPEQFIDAIREHTTYRRYVLSTFSREEVLAHILSEITDVDYDTAYFQILTSMDPVTHDIDLFQLYQNIHTRVPFQQ